MIFRRPYGVATTIDFPMIKRGVVDLAVTADWTPATGDTKISKNEGAVANTTNNPAIASGISWKLDLTATEMQAARISVQIVDSATKAVEDQYIYIETYGHPSAQDTESRWEQHVGIAQGGGASTITLASTASTTNDLYKGSMCAIVAGTGAGQSRVVTGYVGSTRVATVNRAWATNPDATSQYVVFADETADVDVNLDPTSASVIARVTANTDQIEGVDASNQIRDAVVTDATRFAGADIALIKAKTDNLPAMVKKNVALSNFPFLMVDSSDHLTGKTGLTITGTVSKDGGAFAALTNSATEISNGMYKINLAAADLNADTVILKFAGSGADTTLIEIIT
jgi:hypothetical protein